MPWSKRERLGGGSKAQKELQSPLATTTPFSVSKNLTTPFASNDWNHTVVVLLRMAYFT